MKKYLLVLMFIGLLTGCGWLGKAANVVEQETDPHVLLKRYEWFKDCAAELDAKVASIEIYEGRFQRLKAEYAGKARSEWAREDREQANLWEQEVAGIKASYNNLCAIYNAAMVKDNYRWTNIGELPKGCNKPLPREYRTYVSN